MKKRVLTFEKKVMHLKKHLIFILLFNLIVHKSQAQDFEELLTKCEEFYLTTQLDSLKKYANAPIENENLKTISKLKFYKASAIMRTYPDSAFKILNDIGKEFQAQNDLKYLAYWNSGLGNYTRRRGNFKEAINYHEKAINFANQYYGKKDLIKLNRIIAIQTNSISIIYFDMSEYELANKAVLNALEIVNKYNFKQIELASIIILANIQMHFKQLNLAEKSFLTARELAIKLNDTYRLGVAISNLGIINLIKIEAKPQDKKAYLTAKKYFFEALKIAEKQKDFLGLSSRYSNLANVENAVQNYKNANIYLVEALKYADLSKSKLVTLQNTTTLARNFLELGDTKKAIELAQKGLAISKELSNEKDIPNLYDILQKAYTKEKNFIKAMEFQNAQMNAKDSLFKSSTSDKISELQTKYETEKKQKEIELLKAQNQIKEAQIKQKNYLILAFAAGLFLLLGGFYFWYKQRALVQKQTAAEMKQRLLRAQLNPHFLFNCLNSIQRLYIDGKITKANDFIADFAQLMRDILENTSRTHIPIYEEVNYIESYLALEKKRLGNKFDYEIKISPEATNSDFEVPSFIIQPLVENALIHGILPNNIKGKISVIISYLADESLSIVVLDNGVGFYQSLTPSVDHNSKGLELTKTRLGKNGKLLISEIKGSKNEILGTKIELNLI